MVKKTKFELKDSQETLLLPLWGRYLESKKEEPLLLDSKAIEIVEQLDYDFDKFKGKLSDYNALSWCIRAKTIDDAVRHFMTQHPTGIIVNIGCGLDTTFNRVDNGKISWYDLDLPEVIAVKKMVLPATSRQYYISKSLLDYSWFDDIDDVSQPIFFIAGGVLMFFDEQVLKELFSNLAERFPKGEIFFDTLSDQGLKYANDMMKKAGMTSNMLSWGTNSAEELTKWHRHIHVIEAFPYHAKVAKRADWDKEITDIMEMSDNNNVANFYHIGFA